MPGEFETSSKQWETCAYGTYSFGWNSTKCEQWMKHATCLGGTQINVDQGYWRFTQNSSVIIEWPNTSGCIGGYKPENEYPVECTSGYEGLLCKDCQIINGTKYQPSSGFKCSKCPDPILNAIRVVGVIIISLIFLALLIYVNLRKKKETQYSILLRILTNYIQLISASLSFNLNIPTSFDNMFSQVDRISSPSETFFSFDWFISDYEIKLFAPSNSLFKIFLFMFLPILLLIGITLSLVIIRLVMHVISPSKEFDLRRGIGVSFICIIFLFHPTLTSESLSVFLCNQIDENQYRMTHHLEYKCYSVQHLQWAIFVAVPILAIWVIGLPVIGLIILTKNRNKLDDWSIKKYFLIVYQGLKPTCYYWEFVNTFRKFIILGINALTNSFSTNYKLFMSISKKLI